MVVNNDILPPKKPDESAGSTAPQSLPELPQIEPIASSPVDDHPQHLLASGRRSRKLRIVLVSLAAVIMVLAAITIGTWVWYQQQLQAVAPGSSEKVRVTVKPGTDPSGIANLLKANGLIRNETAFGWYVRLSGTAGSLQSGAYRLSKSDNVQTLVEHLTSGKTDTFSITFLPGNTLAKHRQTLLDAGYSQTNVDTALSKKYAHPLFESKPASSDLEGYIYGETYQFPADATPEQILTRTFDQFQSVVEEENLKALYKQRGFTLYEGITLASIIQREVITKSDMAQVSQVFQLRLKRDIQLGSDVTYQYAADKMGVARSVDLDSPYNTRRYPGLPPGPISSPGAAALLAVANPAKGDYLYFLSGDDDKTYFGRTEAEHEANIQKHCQKKCQIL